MHVHAASRQRPPTPLYTHYGLSCSDRRLRHRGRGEVVAGEERKSAVERACPGHSERAQQALVSRASHGEERHALQDRLPARRDAVPPTTERDRIAQSDDVLELQRQPGGALRGRRAVPHPHRGRSPRLLRRMERAGSDAPKATARRTDWATSARAWEAQDGDGKPVPFTIDVSAESGPQVVSLVEQVVAKERPVGDEGAGRDRALLLGL
ncbi:hypothetical protein C8T65DRAFT_670220 [Cerioporus squamosus]|nr:hypothetical protein C8T65DRAFT_670220 [Cerioporus squamosus]